VHRHRAGRRGRPDPVDRDRRRMEHRRHDNWRARALRAGHHTVSRRPHRQSRAAVRGLVGDRCGDRAAAGRPRRGARLVCVDRRLDPGGCRQRESSWRRKLPGHAHSRRRTNRRPAVERRGLRAPPRERPLPESVRQRPPEPGWRRQPARRVHRRRQAAVVRPDHRPDRVERGHPRSTHRWRRSVDPGSSLRRRGRGDTVRSRVGPAQMVRAGSGHPGAAVVLLGGDDH
jgi:hypothetical protein